MFVSLFLAIITPLAFAVVWLGDLYYRELDWQRTQIVLDNAAIRLGHSDLKIARQLEKDRTDLIALHQKYHKSLSCSVLPATAIVCSELSKTLKASIRLLNLRSSLRAQTGWSIGTVGAKKDLNKNGPFLYLNRVSKIALKQKRCGVCGEVQGLMLTDLNQTKSRLFEGGERNLGASVSLVGGGKKEWNYRLWAR